jgi:hypothetical protein
MVLATQNDKPPLARRGVALRDSLRCIVKVELSIKLLKLALSQNPGLVKMERNTLKKLLPDQTWFSILTSVLMFEAATRLHVFCGSQKS